MVFTLMRIQSYLFLSVHTQSLSWCFYLVRLQSNRFTFVILRLQFCQIVAKSMKAAVLKLFLYSARSKFMFACIFTTVFG